MFENFYCAFPENFSEKPLGSVFQILIKYEIYIEYYSHIIKI